MSSEGGYFLIARGFLDHPLFKPRGAFTAAEAMLWLIEDAAFVPHTVTRTVGTKRRFVPLERDGSKLNRLRIPKSGEF